MAAALDGAAAFPCYHPRMWICPECNQLVPNPVNSKCPRGHFLFHRDIFGMTQERSAPAAFIAAFVVCMAVVGVITGINTVVPSHPFNNPLVYVFLSFILAGIISLWRGLSWQRRGGPVSRLVPRAMGTAFGCFVAGGGLLALGYTFGTVR